MISIKDYAKSRGITPQAVYQMIKTHKNELKEHIIKDNKTQFLTPEAEEILDRYRNKASIVIEKADNTAMIESLKEENRNLLIKIANQADKIAELSEWKSDHAIMIAESNAKLMLLEEKIKENEQLNDKLSIALKELEKEKKKNWIQRLFKKE